MGKPSNEDITKARDKLDANKVPEHEPAKDIKQWHINQARDTLFKKYGRTVH